MFLFASSSFAEIPVNPHFTPMSLMPQPFASASGLKVAGIYWLPDYLGKNISRGSSDDVGGGDIGENCEENYGMHTPSNIDDKYTCSKYNYNVTSSLKCHVNCRCKDEYQYTSSNCSGNYTPSGGSCDGKYNACTCKSEFQYNSTNCNGEYQLSGISCGGNYNACVCKSEFQYTSSNCSGNYTTAGTSCEGKYNQCVCLTVQLLLKTAITVVLLSIRAANAPSARPVSRMLIVPTLIIRSRQNLLPTPHSPAVRRDVATILRNINSSLVSAVMSTPILSGAENRPL